MLSEERSVNNPTVFLASELAVLVVDLLLCMLQVMQLRCFAHKGWRTEGKKKKPCMESAILNEAFSKWGKKL